ncbi:MAG: hypothetical protein JWO62_3660 [Acidimicrobiaceae bacterium]|nr:hypothetical protein [Acidimicrobiaceae bacterium]
MNSDHRGTNDHPGGELTAPFWEATARHELVRPVCGSCGRSFFVPQYLCPHCGSENWEYEPSDGRGTVASYTVVHRAPDPRFETPYVVAVVDLVEEGWSLMTNIVGVPGEEVEIGMPVEVSWIEFEGDTLPGFTPREKAAV